MEKKQTFNSFEDLGRILGREQINWKKPTTPFSST